MSENNIETVAASDDRVTLYFDCLAINPSSMADAILEIGKYIGFQGIDVERPTEEDWIPQGWYRLTMTNSAAGMMRYRFATVPEREIEKCLDRWLNPIKYLEESVRDLRADFEAQILSGQSYLTPTATPLLTSLLSSTTSGKGATP
ncbi:UNVERIFIED_ORG: hypothetical protein M2438_002506 [Methylobacterium sp. SuP10 SLI 274]|uniref:hypothetical protein n=1 Tax=Methylorubrum extorquens TaxID=408 RepID=UPI00209D2491|nr:hypothetical protein [Methylorubrum extorquens]MDF9863731.1 hypothetical protein [Methylorubrum pseudosasae]MDH6637331.1 hypothetical protein [Methylobacterium sp. SuP10 SLI 274]MDH6666511.1 hypothetical protein [Methylorubrum zatmanii]MCP1558422.1 hypothetical protein [Methylorubrum extorquens]MDF9792042.1 hypothetical protein [Methylorubrum extorquens]